LGVLWRGKNGEDDHNRAGLKPGVAMNRGKIDARRERKAKRPCSPIGIQSIADYGLMLPKVCQFAEAATCDLGGQVRRSRQQYNSVGNASTSQKDAMPLRRLRLRRVGVATSSQQVLCHVSELAA